MKRRGRRRGGEDEKKEREEVCVIKTHEESIGC